MPEVDYDVGFLGGGQLARMSIQAAQRMGMRCVSLDNSEDTPAAQVSDSMAGSLSDPEDIARLIAGCRIVTLENEFIPAAAILKACEQIQQNPGKIVPNPISLAVIQDKFFQKEALTKAGVPTAKASKIEGDGEAAVANLGFPMVLKSRFGGYDGKGTRTAKSADDFEGLRVDWGQGGWMAEQFIAFRRELAVMVYRTPFVTGTFPTVETVQTRHVCDLVFPCDANAADVAIAAVEAVSGYGLFGVELFETDKGDILVNEIAPRPHNSGHYTLDWGGISQFEMHIRSICGLPCPLPEGRETCMANLLGQEGAGEWRRGLIAALEEDADIRVHWYGKTLPVPGRKMGHINAVGDDIVKRAKAARERFYAAWTGATASPKSS
ncbi:MAG: N5-carboxyaminoimidazole ribonucleotide synthase [Fimbriimonadaceae bacterium]|nr:N5-carboxyaminoimidazole ribonucleotide synthase [Fimbriimonadaceae bacterium]